MTVLVFDGLVTLKGANIIHVVSPHEKTFEIVESVNLRSDISDNQQNIIYTISTLFVDSYLYAVLC